MNQEFGSGLARFYWLRVSHVGGSCRHTKARLGLGDLLPRWLTHVPEELWPTLAGGLSSLPSGTLDRLLERIQDIAAGITRTNGSRESKSETENIFYRLESHMPSFLQYSYTGQLHFVWEGIAQGVNYQEVRIVEGRDSVKIELNLEEERNFEQDI